MEYRLQIIKGELYPLGVHRVAAGLSIVSEPVGKEHGGIILYVDADGRKKEYKIDFKPEYLVNGLYCILLPDFPYTDFEYLYYADGKKITDRNAVLIASSHRFGDAVSGQKTVRCCHHEDVFDWGNDVSPEIPFQDAIIYKIHMRGFTRHASSNVMAKGTFRGLKEKIAYIKALGVTTIETMPIFEFNDVIYNPLYTGLDDKLVPYLDDKKGAWKSKVNYWGYTDGHYFAPKRAYAYGDRPDLELKELVKALHAEQLELVADFYFPPEIPQWFILEVCRYWVREYHLDGFKLMGCYLPVQLLITDPYLKHTKLIFESLQCDVTANKDCCKHVAVISGGFLYDIRRYLKGDEDMIRPVMQRLRDNPSDYALINEISSYQGFTLADSVSYDRKHNELNGEDNRDGSDYNYSWNCGAEGKTRKKKIIALREQQSKNALLLLFGAQATPVLLAGDEFGNSAYGNNNPYCQDNAVSWLEWKETAYGSELLDFTKKLIAFRKKHPILHMEKALTQSDYLSAGYPDISYHCEQAWYAGTENYNRHFGVLYCGSFATTPAGDRDDFIYITYNTHWIEHEFALPKLPDRLKFKPVMATCANDSIRIPCDKQGERKEAVILPPRSMAVFISVKETEL